MKVVYLALKMIWKQKFLNFFLMVTIVLSIYYLAPVFSQVIHYADSSQTLKGLESEHSYYIYCNPHYSKRDSFISNSIDAKIADIGYVTGHAESYNLSSDNSSYKILGYNDNLITNFIPRIESGIWLDIEDKDNDYIPVVVSADTKLSIDEIFPLDLILPDGRKQSFTCKVVGTLRPDAMVITFSGAADDEYFTSDALLSNAASTIILPMTRDIEKFISDEAYLLSASGSILYTSDNTIYEDVLNDFGYAGIVTDLNNGNIRFYEQSKIVVAAMGAYFLLYLIVTIVCLLCSNFILNTNAQRTYTIYFLTGMSKLTRMAIEVLRAVLLIFASTTISYLFLIKSGLIQTYYVNVNPVLVLAGILFYICLVFIPISAIFVLKNRKKDMINSIRILNIES